MRPQNGTVGNPCLPSVVPVHKAVHEAIDEAGLAVTFMQVMSFALTQQFFITMQ